MLPRLRLPEFPLAEGIVNLLEPLLDSWRRNNSVLVQTLHSLPECGLAAKAAPDGASVGQYLSHIHYVRLVHVYEDAPEYAVPVPEQEWQALTDRHALVRMLEESARVVGAATRGRIDSGKPMNLHYDHPLLMIQHLLWHEAYHLGQIKLALKLSGLAMPDAVAGPVSWGIWMKKSPG
ncbi:MAG: hypothetical protein ICCCNLDF_01320 [Planctomycetes bacterium]|nr:hypothetical protein [Planctomycetota bacterium]